MKLPEELQFIRNSYLPQKKTDARMDGRVCVISGTTSGIGYEAAKQLVRGGARLVMICRNKDKAIKVQQVFDKDYGAEAEFVIADLQKLTEVQRAADRIGQKYKKIHILINNAGVFNKCRRLTQDGYELTFGVIHLASFLLTRLLIENLKRGAPSRVIDVNSEAHRFGGLNVKDINWERRPFIGLRAYGAAKIAQLYAARQLAEDLRDSGVTVNAIHPGAVRTNIGMNNNIFYRFYSRYLLKWFLKDPAVSAEAIYYLAAAPELEKVTGKFFNLTIEEEPAWYVLKEARRGAVLELSEEMIKPFMKGDQ